MLILIKLYNEKLKDRDTIAIVDSLKDKEVKVYIVDVKKYIR